MSIERTVAGDVTVLRLDGDLLGLNAEELKAVARESLKEGRRDFIVDLSDANVCDSAGLEALTWLQRQCEERLALIKLTGLNDTVRKILEITRLSHRFEDPFDGL